MKKYEIMSGVGLLITILGVVGAFGNIFDPTPALPFPWGFVLIVIGVIILSYCERKLK